MKPLSRRNFLGLSGLVAGTWVGDAVVDRVRERSLPLLRPPGAKDEIGFLASCTRCGQCVEACPTQVLHLATAQSGLGLGTPYLIARERACNLCQGHDEMKCIASCPTDALLPAANWRSVDMGEAVIDRDACYAWQGTSCRACWHACPFPGDAIALDELGRAMVQEEHCVGCGLCEYACLTEHPAIVIRPRAAAHSSDGDALADLATGPGMLSPS